MSRSPGQGADLRWLEVAGRRKPALYVPAGIRKGAPVPFVVLLHGAGAGASDILPLMQSFADKRQFLLLAPQSQGATWDAIQGSAGPDVQILDRALDSVFSDFDVDAGRVAVAGFSDGASYALGIGLPNAGLFTHVLAFSPGFIAGAAPAGSRPIFVSHGKDDPVLPIERCSRRIVPRLRQLGYAVDYREFVGGHVVPTEMVEAALGLWLDG